MEIDDVFTDEVMDLIVGICAPESIKIDVRMRVAVVLKCGHVADRRIEPDIEIFARFTWNLKAKVGRVATDIPVLQAGG